MRKVVSLMLALALAGMLGVTAGCKKKEEAPKEPPKPVAPANQTDNQTANQTDNQTANQTDNQTANQTGGAPAEKK